MMEANCVCTECEIGNHWILHAYKFRAIKTDHNGMATVHSTQLVASCSHCMVEATCSCI